MTYDPPQERRLSCERLATPFCKSIRGSSAASAAQKTA